MNDGRIWPMSSAPKKILRTLIVSLVVLAATPVMAEGSLSGHVRNGTTGTAAANVPVVLIQLQGGMQTVANTKTDSQGRFHFDHPAVGKQPMLVRAIYRGVNFHQPLPPGGNIADVEVFEPTTDPNTISVPSRLVVFQPNGSNLLIGEEYVVQNKSNPPSAFFKEKGNFEFQISGRAELQQVAAWGPSGMPVVQGTMDRGANRHAIAFAFRPGESGVRMSYQLPYPGNQATVRMTSPYPINRMVIVVPPTVKISSPGFQPAGSEQGMNLYARDVIPAGTAFDVEVSGTAPPPSAQGAPTGSSAEPSQERAENRAIQTLPSRIDALKWPIVSGFATLFVLGAIFLWRKPSAAFANGGTANASQETFSTARQTKTNASSLALRMQSQPGVETPGAVENTEREVQNSLDGLKDSLFRLELRHQAGTISDDEYARERARFDQILRELVKG